MICLHNIPYISITRNLTKNSIVWFHCFFYKYCWQMKFIAFSIICSSSNTYLIIFQYSHAASIHNFVFVFKTDIFVSHLINCIFVFNQFFNYCKNILLQWKLTQYITFNQHKQKSKSLPCLISYNCLDS